VSILSRAFETYTQARREHWDSIARRLDSWSGWGGLYQKLVISK